MRKLIILTVIALLAIPALALAKVPVHGSTKVAIAKAAGFPAAQVNCVDAYLAGKRSHWAIQTTPVSDIHKTGCQDLQPGDFAILLSTKGRWHVVTEADEVVCPFQSRPHEPTIPGKVLKQLTDHYCPQ